MSAQDRERVEAAIRAVEARSSGEIVCVLAQSSADTTTLPVSLAAVAALALPWLLVATTALPVSIILTAQVLLFVALAIVLSLPQVRVSLLPRRVRRLAAFRVAAEQFVARGIARKHDRSGILIFVSLAERYARIVADDGIAARVSQSRWQDAVAALISHMREDRIADGFIAAIGICGEELVRHYPRGPADRQELPDRIYFI
jgi:putative membrane protein